MSPQGVAALYGVVTFALLAGAWMAAVHWLFGWPFIPDVSRLQGTLTLAWYAIAGFYSRAVGAHGARGATLGQAWGEGLGDIRKAVRSVIFR
jgi:hypothetical protein